MRCSRRAAPPNGVASTYQKREEGKRMAQGPTNFGNGITAPYMFLRAMPFARLPANPQFGMQAVVSDSTTVVSGATVTGGGTNRVAAFYNGTNWVVDASVAGLP